MWRVIFIAAIFISSFFPSTGDSTCPAGFRKESSKCRELDDGLRCPNETRATARRNGVICFISKRYCSPTPLSGPIDASLLATPGCQEGFTLATAHGVCAKKNGGTVLTSCTASIHFNHPDNGVCRVSIDLLQVCPENSNLPTGCIPREYYTDRLTGNRKIDNCYQGYVTDPEEPKKCVFTQSAVEPFCPNGFNLDTSINKCLSEWNVPGYRYCERGSLHDNDCVEVKPIKFTCSLGSGHFQDSTTARFSCLQGVWSGTSCQNTRNVEPIASCHGGFRPVSEGQGCESIDTIDASPSL